MAPVSWNRKPGIFTLCFNRSPSKEMFIYQNISAFIFVPCIKTHTNQNIRIYVFRCIKSGINQYFRMYFFRASNSALTVHLSCRTYSIKQNNKMSTSIFRSLCTSYKYEIWESVNYRSRKCLPGNSGSIDNELLYRRICINYIYIAISKQNRLSSCKYFRSFMATSG